MRKYKKHIFVCVNQRENNLKKSCGNNGLAIRDKFVEELKDILDNAKSFLRSKKLVPDYFELRDSELNPISKNDFEGNKVFLGSVTINNTRLIDNIEF